MKNLRTVISVFSLLFLGALVYLSSIGYSSTELSQNKKEVFSSNPSSTVLLWINLTDIGGNHCLDNNYEYCINGGLAIQVSTEGFYAEVPCNETFTICVRSGNCTGSYTGSVSCDSETFRNINLSPFNPDCSCTH